MFYPAEVFLDNSLANDNIIWGQDYTWDGILFRKIREPWEDEGHVTNLFDTLLSKDVPQKSDNMITQFFAKFSSMFKAQPAVERSDPDVIK